MDILSRSGDSVKKLWAGLNGPQRFVLALSAVLMVVLLIWGSRSASGESWQRVIGHEVSEGERAEALKALAQKKIVYEVRGGEIWVPKAQADKVVLELAGDGALSEKAVWKWLESSDVFATKWEKEKRFQIALQRKLELMIRAIENVRSASVQITPASEAGQLGFQGPKASASVQVDLKPGSVLSTANVKAIAGIVSHAVPGLDPDRVHLMDSQGRAYRIPKVDEAFGSAGDLMEIEAQMEARVRDKIAGLFPNARVVVRAFARGKGERRETLKHGTAVPYEERNVRKVKESGPRPGVPPIKGGVDSVEPSSEPLKVVEQEDETRSKVDQTTTQVYDPAGQIDRVTVGVLLPVPVNAQGQPVGRTPPLDEVRKLAMMASGAKLEDISVVALETRAPEPVAAPQAGEVALDWFFANWTNIALAFLAFFALIVVAFAVRGALSREDVEEIKSISERIGEPERAAALADPLRAGAEPDVLRRGVQEAVERDPDDAAAALKAWVAGR